jgi:hypothetical protein
MTRHFAGWKLRYFQLNIKNGILEIHSPDKSSSTYIHLSLPSVSIGRHYYAVDKYKWLWLKYYDKIEKCPKEVIMKFEYEENISYWEKNLNDVIELYRNNIKQNSLEFLNILMDFLQEQSKLQVSTIHFIIIIIIIIIIIFINCFIYLFYRQ